MKSSDLRNVVLLGHGGMGKTSLAEAMLYNAGAIDRLGRVSEGNTVLDCDPEEIRRKASVSLSIAPFDWRGSTVNIIDTPGYFDFAGEMLEGVSVVDSAVIVVSSTMTVGTEKAWEFANSRNIPRVIFVNKMHDENADFDKIYAELKEMLGKPCVALQLPIRKNGKLVGVVDGISLQARVFDDFGNLVDGELPADMVERAEEIHMNLSEIVAETDPELMEKFFGGERFTREEIIKGLKVAINNCTCAPVLLGSSYENVGVKKLMDFIVDYMPSPLERTILDYTDADGNALQMKPDPDGHPTLFVYKTIADPFVGRLSLFRVCSGTMTPDTIMYNANKGADEKIGQIFVLRGRKQIPVKELVCGDLGAVAKLSVTTTNDTLGSKTKPIIISATPFPEPQLTLGIVPKSRGDEEKISAGISKLKDEDPVIQFNINKETGQMLVSGLGDQHIDTIVSKLKTRYGVEVELEDPKIPYRETIKKKVSAEGLHKKQSGGAGQYGKVVIEFEPGENPELEFCEKVFGGAVPKQFFPSVEKGLQESVKKGALAGYPVVNLKATLVDGKYHPVDSKEVAFVSAAKIAFKAAMKDAKPVLLEPVYSMNIYVPERYMGDIMGDMNKRRGRVLGMNPMDNNMQEIVAEAPYSEVFKYAVDLRSMTQARGSFKMEFVRYEEVPESIAKKIVDEAKKNMSDDED
ncbi:MAG: elongation factor G [Ruminococcaceae bacterium]|nr:elongation factor G [Oscillospiraceae bacterium]